MQTQYSGIKFPKALSVAILGLMAGFSVEAVADSGVASQTVKTSQCKNNLTINQSLEKSIKSSGFQDLGWYAFEDHAAYDVVRVVMVAKGTELRYRWRLAADGTISPVNQAAASLCETGDRAS